MILRGIIDNSLNGQLCIRGFAPIKELANISKADYSYQRNPIQDREDISDFLKNETYLFFPEVILSYKIKHDFSKSKDTLTPLQKIQSNKSFKSNIDQTSFKIKKIDYKSIADAKGVTTLSVVEIEINNLADKPFHRIDGNHRLKAAEESTAEKVDRMVAPFCIILGQEFYENGAIVTNTETENFDKAIKVFFHNINTKTIPLTSEENLKVIIDDKLTFPDTELQELLGDYALLTRTLIDKVSPEYFEGIQHIISGKYRTYYNSIFWILLERGEDKDTLVEKVFNSLKAIDLLYSENDSLKANSSFGLLTAFLYYHVQGNKAKFDFFKDWILNNHIFEIQEVKDASLVNIFDKISARSISVFVAMPYYDGSTEIMKTYNDAYNRVISKITANFPHISISLLPIMTHRGETRDIINNMINEIQSCSVFIADITGGNPNVGYELGIARALKKPTIIVRQLGDTVKVPFDYEHDVRNPYNEKAISTLEDEVYNNLIGILSSNYGYVIENI
ncbi:hypothetical protein [Flavobacterium sp. WV_118_3]|uniref:hypothetical protein n=1 Tax=Flavobacterium sp. WV_118_3 TaxID=3151764 RepID=UPI003219103E